MEKILIATILKPQGLKGELKCKLENKNYSIIQNVTEVYLNDKTIPTRIIEKSYRTGYLYLTLGTIDSREKADLVRNFKVYASKDSLILPQDEYLVSDLIGMSVYDAENQQIGKLLDVQNYGAGDILVIEQYNREYLVPFVDDIVKRVNLQAGIIVVDRKKYNESKICD